jgi:glycerophosphoryl diester phosphodiesterase
MSQIPENLLSKHPHGSDDDLDLATRYAPIVQFDSNEPFLPSAAGYTIFRESSASPSFPRHIELATPGEPEATIAIEYAIWWDWDIEHLYELEHVWVYLDADGRVIRGEASWHGRYHNMALNGELPLSGDRLTLFAESGKHAFAPTRAWLDDRYPITLRSCTQHAGLGGVWVTPLFEGVIGVKTFQADRLVHTYLEQYAFEPAMDFTKIHEFSPKALVPWPALYEWIPGRVAWWVSELEQTIPPHKRRFLRIAHRGASSYAPPNTLTAIARAAELRADMVELDVQLSADGFPVITHPGDIRQLVKDVCTVSEHTLEELKKIDLGGGATIPTLEEAIECCLEYGLSIYFELKGYGVAQPVVEAIQRYRLHHQVMVTSFRPDWLADVKALDPGIVTSILFASVDIDAVALARAIGAQVVHPAWEAQHPTPHKLLTPNWIDRIRAAGLGLICWHEERPSEIAALRQLGVDGICSDAPDLLL